MMSDSFFESGLHDPDWPAPARVKAVITSRHGGVSAPPYESNNLGLHVGDAEEAVMENRKLLAEVTGKQLDFQWLTQVHGNTLLTLDKEVVDEGTQADALYTRQKNIACGVLTADCLSVFFCDESGAEIAVAHAGWRGLASGILEKTIATFNAEPNSLLAYLGPVIGPCHFEVGDEVRQAFLDLDLPEIINQDSILFHENENNQNKWMADLYAIAKIILASRGVTKIYGEPICTYCEFDNYYSYRRDGKTGRFASLIWKE
jgi:polyphenol oxidase